MNYCIYKITNNYNNKIYIGTTSDFNRRMKEHFYCLKNKREQNRLLYKEIKKYEFENFKKEIIEYCEKENLYEREKYYIKLYDSNNSSIGYNQTIGGIGGITHNINGKNNPMYNKEVSLETKNKISESLKGKEKSETHKNNLSIANKGILPPNTKECSVINIHTNEILNFLSEVEMEKQLKCSRKTINKGNVTRNGYKKYIKKEGQETIENII